MANKRFFQVFAMREAVPGVAESTLIDAANAKFVLKDPQFTYDVETFEREVAFASLSPLTQYVGKVEGTLTFSCELSGHTTAGAAMVQSLLLEACGLRKVAIYGGTWDGIMTGSASGTAKVAQSGDLWRNTANDAIIRVYHDTYESAGSVADSRSLYFEIVSGAVIAEAFFPSASTLAVGPVITLTGGTPASQKAWGFVPISIPILTATAASSSGTHTAGDTYKGGTSNCVVQSQNQVSDSTLREFRVLDGIPTSGETFTNLSQTGTTVLSAFAQTDYPSLSMALAEDSRIKKLKGARGTVKLSGSRGKPVLMEFTFKGVVHTIADGAGVTGVTYESKVPPRFFGSALGFLMGTYTSGDPGYYSHATAHTPRISDWSYDMGGGARLETDATQSTGLAAGSAVPSQRKSTGSMTVAQRPEALFPFIRALQNGQRFWQKLRLAGTPAINNIFLISLPACTQSTAAPGDNDGFGTDSLSYGLSTARPDGGESDSREICMSQHFSASSTW